MKHAWLWIYYRLLLVLFFGASVLFMVVLLIGSVFFPDKCAFLFAYFAKRAHEIYSGPSGEESGGASFKIELFKVKWKAKDREAFLSSSN